MRADQYLVENKYFESRAKAQAAIEEGLVSINGKKIKKSSEPVEAGLSLEVLVQQGQANQFVSRGGLKLAGALEHLRLDIAGLTALDIGVSTGGFSDCLLKKGASFVVGIDVGHGQVHESLKIQENFKFFEGIHIKNLKPAFLGQMGASEKYDLIVMDVSFISLKIVVPFIKQFLKPSGHVLSLVKPQFELSAQCLNKKGIVKNPEDYNKVEKNTKNTFEHSEYKVLNYFESPIQGGDGNREFFIYAQNS